MFEDAARDTATIDNQMSRQKQARDYPDGGGAPKSPDVHRAIQEIADLLNDMNKMVVRVGCAADRISGPIPSEVGSDSSHTAPQTLMAKLGIVYSAIKNMNEDLRSHIGRIEKTV